MLNLYKKTIRFILKKIGLLELMQLRKDALREYGWEPSAKQWKSVDPQELPIPWLTYPAIDLLASRIKKDINVFEYGSGNSTLWWSAHARKVISVEHDAEWYRRLKPAIPSNAHIRHIELIYGEDYCKASSSEAPHDIIVVDGRDRVNCLKQSINNLSDIGVIILDNSDRTQYQEGVEFIKQHGFKQLPLRGLAPIVTYISETSIFYRPKNCLDI